MPSPPKPWKPYWKVLESNLDNLLEHAPPSPIRGKVRDWIANLRFEDSFWVEESFRFWLAIKEPYPEFSGNNMARTVVSQWETILRFMFALDFVKGRWGKRKEFDFSRDQNVVLMDLLSNLWREDAFYWCARCLNETGDSRRRGETLFPRGNPNLN